MIINVLLLFVPLSLLLRYLWHAPQVWVFFAGVIAIIPLADWIRRATEHLAHRAGSAIGGLLNVTLGNMAELIIALFVLADGHTEVVKAQITGSLIGNSLLGLGLAAFAGGWGRESQKFKQARAGLLGSLLVLSVIALLIPALFDYTERGVLHVSDPSRLNEGLSLGVSVVLIIVYVANIVYTLVTHRDVFAFTDEPATHVVWPLSRTLGVLAGATALIAVEAELVSGALEATAQSLGLTDFFIGLIVLAVVGNAAEYISAVYFARRDRMGLVMTITVGSTIQVALLTAPLLVIISFILGRPMTLVFSNPLELAAIAAVAMAVNGIAQDGETTWFEGLLLLAVYVVFGIAFFFVGR